MILRKNLSWFISLFACLVTVLDAVAQELPVDDSGKISFSDVAIADSLSKEKLFLNSLRWIKTLNTPEEKFTFVHSDSIKTKSEAQLELQVFAQSGLLRKMVGLITCSLSLETKDIKYRYSFSNFIFHYYTQNRNYQLVATGKTKPLEESHAAGWQKQWDKHKQFTVAKINALIASLKIEMAKKNQTSVKKSTKVEW